MSQSPRARSSVVFDSVLHAIGNTPIVALERLCAGMPGLVYVKLEFLNPGLSKKDRMALRIIDEAERSGALQAGQTVVELTSGNAGTGLAIVCAVRGYPFVAVMSRGNSEERARMMRALGAEVVLVDQAPGGCHGQVSGADLERVEGEAQRLVRTRNAFRADQFSLPGNYLAHRDGTGQELIKQLGERLDAFCDFVGSGGSFVGCATALKQHNPDTRCYIVEPGGAAVLSGQPATCPGHRIQGGGYVKPELAFLDRGLVDGYLQVSDEEAVYWMRRLARREGILAGISTGANLAAAVQLIEQNQDIRSVAILANDSGLKYVSTGVWG